ncbi:MAG TPA: hypothetical protein VFW65_35455 [Pseudonocardiaceae bacterium]|nr:hypothetical protein [Pseudonocardiaceae bacterium]
MAVPSRYQGRGVWALSGRGATAAALGALLGLIINQIDGWAIAGPDQLCYSYTPPGQACSGEGNGLSPIGFAYGGVAIGVLVTIAICWIGVAVARIRPVRASVPLGILLTVITVSSYAEISGNREISRNSGPPGSSPWSSAACSRYFPCWSPRTTAKSDDADPRCATIASWMSGRPGRCWASRPTRSPTRCVRPWPIGGAIGMRAT